METDREATGITVEDLAAALVLDEAMRVLGATASSYEFIDHWQQGEFHHDIVLRLRGPVAGLAGPVVVIATNCNGGVKEVLNFDELPDRYALWHHRCPDNPEFEGELPPLRARATTVHWFDPCDLLRDDARSELRPEWRVRQRGGGWMRRTA